MASQMHSGFVMLHLGAWVQALHNNMAKQQRVVEALDKRLRTLFQISMPVIYVFWKSQQKST